MSIRVLSVLIDFLPSPSLGSFTFNRCFGRFNRFRVAFCLLLFDVFALFSVFSSFRSIVYCFFTNDYIFFTMCIYKVFFTFWIVLVSFVWFRTIFIFFLLPTASTAISSFKRLVNSDTCSPILEISASFSPELPVFFFFLSSGFPYQLLVCLLLHHLR